MLKSIIPLLLLACLSQGAIAQTELELPGVVVAQATAEEREARSAERQAARQEHKAEKRARQAERREAKQARRAERRAQRQARRAAREAGQEAN